MGSGFLQLGLRLDLLGKSHYGMSAMGYFV